MTPSSPYYSSPSSFASYSEQLSPYNTNSLDSFDSFNSYSSSYSLHDDDEHDIATIDCNITSSVSPIKNHHNNKLPPTILNKIKQRKRYRSHSRSPSPCRPVAVTLPPTPKFSTTFSPSTIFDLLHSEPAKQPQQHHNEKDASTQTITESNSSSSEHQQGVYITPFASSSKSNESSSSFIPYGLQKGSYVVTLLRQYTIAYQSYAIAEISTIEGLIRLIMSGSEIAKFINLTHYHNKITKPSSARLILKEIERFVCMNCSSELHPYVCLHIRHLKRSISQLSKRSTKQECLAVINSFIQLY